MRILFIDGMGAPQIGWNSLVLPMLEKYPGNDATYSQWQDWQNYGGRYFDAIIGHSLGGDSAIQFCTQAKIQPKLLMTLGARHQSAASWLDFLFPLGLQSFAAPNAVTHNFYTIGLLSSQPVTGAAENVNVTSLNIWHGNIPSAPAVQSCLENFLRSPT